MHKYAQAPWSTANGFIYDANGRAVAQIIEHYPEDVVAGNGRLLAAAPELLAALGTWVSDLTTYDDYIDPEDRLEDVRRMIAKVVEESPDQFQWTDEALIRELEGDAE